MIDGIFLGIFLSVVIIGIVFLAVSFSRIPYEVHINMTVESYKDYTVITFVEFKELIEKYHNDLFLSYKFPGSIFSQGDKVSIHARLFMIDNKKVMARSWAEFFEMERFRKDLLNSLKTLNRFEK